MTFVVQTAVFIISVLGERVLPGLHTGPDSEPRQSEQTPGPFCLPPTSGSHVFTTQDNREEGEDRGRETVTEFDKWHTCKQESECVRDEERERRREEATEMRDRCREI